MYIMGIDTSIVTLTGGVPAFALGQLGQTQDGKIYKYIQYDEGAAAVDGVASEMAYYYTLDGYKNNQVTSDLSDSVEIPAGMLVNAMSDGDYGWIQIRGAATLALALTAGADGDPLTPTGSADGTLDVSAAVTDIIGAIAGDISDKEVILVCPF